MDKLEDAYETYLKERSEIEDRYFRKIAPKNGFWYLATVYTSYPKGLEQAYMDACKQAALCLENGIKIFCPIAHTHTASKFMDLEKFDHDFWMQFDYLMLDCAKGLIVTKMDNWENSKGINLEIDYAKKHNKPIIYTEFMCVPKIG